MAVLAIEVHDAGMRAAKDTEPGLESFPASPGVALWDDGTLVTGQEAVRRARYKPRWSHDRFWQEIDTTPLPSPFPAHLRRADLAHAHLQEIWSATSKEVEDVLLVVPGSFSSEQLGLILGIARSCGMPVSGMIDHALAASLLAESAPDGPSFVHLDLQLHRAVATRVRRGPTLERAAILVDEDAGMVELFDTWVKFIAQRFVHTTRFDPLHRGETEQALYDRLSGWLNRLRQKESAVLDMRSADKDYSVELSREEIVSAALPLLQRIAQLARSAQRLGEPTVLILPPAVAELPGMLELLRGPDVELFSLPAAAGALGALRRKDAIRSASRHGGGDDTLAFVTRLPRDEATTPGKPIQRDQWVPPPAGSHTTPTHVVWNGFAHSITSQPLVLGLETPGHGIDLGTTSESTAGISRSHCTIFERDGCAVLEDHSSYGTFLNDKRVEGEAILAAGDRVRVGTPGIELRLIQVVDSNGTAKD